MEDMQQRLQRLIREQGAEALLTAVTDDLYEQGSLGETLDRIDNKIRVQRQTRPVYRSQPRTELSMRREAAQRDQHRRWGDSYS